MKTWLAGVPGGGWAKREKTKLSLEESTLVVFLFK